MSKDNQEVESNEEVVATEAAETKTAGAPVSTPNDTISAMLPDERISRSKALNIVRGQDIKCSQERMTKILEEKYGPAPTAEEQAEAKAKVKADKDAVKAEAKAKRDEEREAKKTAKAEAKKVADEAKAKLKAEVQAKRDAAKEAGKTEEKPAV